MAQSNDKSPAFKIDRHAKLPWEPRGWRCSRDRRVTLSRPPRGAADLLRWIRFVQESSFYHLAAADPNFVSEGLGHAVWNTWTLLRYVSRRRKWHDCPTRPEPDRVVVGDIIGTHSEFSASAVNRELNKLREYLLQKLPRTTNSSSTGSPPLTPRGDVPPKLREKEWAKCREILEAILQLDHKTDAVTAVDVAKQLATGIDPAGGGFKTKLSQLVEADLAVSGRKHGYRITELGRHYLNMAPPNG